MSLEIIVALLFVAFVIALSVGIFGRSKPNYRSDNDTTTSYNGGSHFSARTRKEDRYG